MLKKLKQADRYSLESFSRNEPDPKGRIFVHHDGSRHDLSGVKILHFGVDTVRQLYKGTLSVEMLGELHATLDAHKDRFQLEGETFHLSKMGKASGYRFKLQNNELGLVLLVGSYYAKADSIGSHLKIEVSPHLCARWGARYLTSFLHGFAKALLKAPEPAGVAVHYACDFQGWDVPEGFVERFVTRTRSFRDYFGIDQAEFNLSEAATTYGRKESFTFGKADALQACLYRKDLEATKRDKIDYWRAVWGQNYVENQPVWRLEMRFHHTVLADIGRGFGVVDEFKTLEDVEPFTPDIWGYALTNNRSEIKKNFIAPIWQLLRDDAPTDKPMMKVKRVKKTSSGNVARNIANTIGNMVSLYAREKRPVRHLWTAVKRLHIWETIKAYYYSRGMDEGEIFRMLDESLQLRRLVGHAA